MEQNLGDDPQSEVERPREPLDHEMGRDPPSRWFRRSAPFFDLLSLGKNGSLGRSLHLQAV